MENNNIDLSLSLQIPADVAYLPNALATVESICEHFELKKDSASKIVETINEALKESFSLSTHNPASLLSLNFSITNPLLKVELENQTMSSSVQASNLIGAETFKESSDRIKNITEDFSCKIYENSDSYFSMCFNLNLH